MTAHTNCSSTFSETQATLLIADYKAAKRKAESLSGYLPSDHPARRSQNGKSQSALRRVKRAGIHFCSKCHGDSVVWIPTTPKVAKCECCNGTGIDEHQNWIGVWTNEVCWKCHGTRYTVYQRDTAVTCPHCHGTRIEPKADNVIALDSAFDGDARAKEMAR